MVETYVLICSILFFAFYLLYFLFVYDLIVLKCFQFQQFMVQFFFITIHFFSETINNLLHFLTQLLFCQSNNYSLCLNIFFKYKNSLMVFFLDICIAISIIESNICMTNCLFSLQNQPQMIYVQEETMSSLREAVKLISNV